MKGWEKRVEQVEKAARRVCNERTGVEIINEFGVVNGVDTAIGEGCWWRRWVGTDIYASKSWIVI